MTALTLPQPPALRLNWPRVGAASGTLSLHALAIALLLIPPAAIHLLNRQIDDKVIVTLVEPRPRLPDPPPDPEPVRIVHKAPPMAKPTPAPTPAPTPPLVVDTPSNEPAADPGPPGPDAGATTIADTAPTALAYLTRTPVPYPHDAAQRHEQGTVILRVLVGADGVPQTVEIEKSSGFRSLDIAARNAVSRWTFTPGTVNGVRSALWARVPIAFTLQNL